MGARVSVLGALSGAFRVLSCGFRVPFGCALVACVWFLGDQRVCFGCSCVDFGWLVGAFKVRSCGFQMTFGCLVGTLWSFGLRFG